MEQLSVGGLQDKFLTHNHPVDTSFSTADLNMFLTNRLLGIRAVTKTQTYQLISKNNFMTPKQILGVIKDYKRYSKLTRIRLTHKYNSKEITADQFSTMFDHTTMIELSKDYVEYFEYKKL